MPVVPFLPAIATVGSALIAKNSSKGGSATSTTQQQLDPRAQAILYGDGTDGNKGLLSQYQQFLNQPQGTGTSMLGQASQGFLGANAPDILNRLYAGSAGLMSPTQAPQATAAQAAAQTGVNPFGTKVVWNPGQSVQAPNALQAAQVGAPQRDDNTTAGLVGRRHQ